MVGLAGLPIEAGPLDLALCASVSLSAKWGHEPGLQDCWGQEKIPDLSVLKFSLKGDPAGGGADWGKSWGSGPRVWSWRGCSGGAA